MALLSAGMKGPGPSAADAKAGRKPHIPISRVENLAQTLHFSAGPFAIFGIILAVAPFWYAGVPSLARMMLGLLLGLLALWLFVRHLLWREGFVAPLAMAAVPLIGFTIVAAWALVQALLPLPSSLGDPVFPLVADLLKIHVVATLSPAPADTLLALLTLACAMLAFLMALEFAREPQRAAMGIRLVAWIAAAYAFWGMVDHFAQWNMVLFEPKNPFSVDSFGGYVSSTFRNFDHFADLCLIGVACAGSLALRDTAHLGAQLKTGSGRLRDFASLAQDLSILLILMIALWLSRSRAGLAASALAFATMMVLAGIGWLKAGKRRRVLAVGGALVALLVVAAALGLEAAGGNSRFASLGAAASDRWQLYCLVAAGARDNWLTGTGFGAFRDAFTVYRTAELGYGAYWNAAHNIYLEAVFGLGLPIALALFAGVGWPVWRVFRGALTRRRHVVAPLAAASAAVGLLAHGLFDFGLQTPAIAVLFAALVGFGCAQSSRTHHGK